MRLFLLIFSETIKAILEVLEEVSIFLIRIPIDMIAGLIWVVFFTGAFLRLGRVQRWATSALNQRPTSLQK